MEDYTKGIVEDTEQLSVGAGEGLIGKVNIES
jgi:hypothetical protein